MCIFLVYCSLNFCFLGLLLLGVRLNLYGGAGVVVGVGGNSETCLK